MRRALGIATVVAAALLAAGCFADQTRYRDSGPIVEEAKHALAEEHHAEDAHVECIKREVQGAIYHCRAEAAGAEFECEVERSVPKQETKAIECERHGEHAEEGEPAEGHEPAETEPAKHEPAETEPPADEHAEG